MKKLMIVLFAVFPILFFGCADDEEKENIHKSISSSLKNDGYICHVEIIHYRKITEEERLVLSQANTMIELERVTGRAKHLDELIRISTMFGGKMPEDLKEKTKQLDIRREDARKKYGITSQLLEENPDNKTPKYYLAITKVNEVEDKITPTDFIMSLDYKIVESF